MLSLFQPFSSDSKHCLLTQADGTPLPNAEVVFYPEFYPYSETSILFEQLMQELKWQQNHITFYGKKIPVPRLEVWHGDSGKTYQYSGNRFEPQLWTDLLSKIKEKIEKETNSSFNSVLINLYRNAQDSVGWHSDDEPELGTNPVIASLSLGAIRKFRLRYIHDKTIKTEILLPSGSLLMMKGNTQHHWQHEVPKSRTPSAPRINLTFRKVFT